MWFAFSFTAGLLFTVSALINRYLLKGNKDAWSYSFWFSFIAAIITFPFMLADYEPISNIITVLLFIVIGILITFHNYLNLNATRFISPTIQNAINRIRLVWVFILGIILFNNEINIMLIIGVTLIITASLIVLVNFRKKQEARGITLSLVATIVYAIVISLYSEVLKDTNAFTLTFFIFLIPAIFNLVIIPNKLKRLPKLIKTKTEFVLFAIIAAALANLSLNYALELGEQGKVITIPEVASLLLIIGESLILKEKKKILLKSIVLILAITGAVLISIF